MSEQSHQSAPVVLNRRTLQHDHHRLAELLQPGMSVLDVGCGPGAITAGIARMIAPNGQAVGVDRDESLLAIANQQYQDSDNLTFQFADALSLPFENRFDVVTAARTLQWISQPDLALRQMKKAAKTGGHIVVLDYNHDYNKWEPAPPAEFIRFYAAFLAWRAANHWSNRMAELLPDLFHSEGMADVQTYIDDQVAERGDPDFPEAATIWGHVVDRTGPQIVSSGHLSEQEMIDAAERYQDYAQKHLQRQTLSMRTVIGRNHSPTAR